MYKLVKHCVKFLNKKSKISQAPLYDIGILSLNITTKCYNFGAALDSYAFQTYLNKKGLKSIIIHYLKENNGLRIYNFPLVLIKKFKFEQFFKKHCITTPKKYTQNSIVTIDNIRRFVCETDITWTRFQQKFDPVFMCSLPNMKYKDNIAYSVDFGTREFSPDDIEILKNYSNNFKYISIRNIFKLKYIQEILERQDIVTTIDPVFLIDFEDYKKITKKYSFNKKFVLVYNCKENNPAMIIKAKNYAKKNNLEVKIINCWNKNYSKKKLYFPTPIGIEEFLGLVNTCECIFTNSYHGICFSIIYQKPFYAFSRIANNDKILTILGTFNLNSRLVTDTLPETEIDYNQVKNLLSTHRKMAEDFLKKALEPTLLDA